MRSESRVYLEIRRDTGRAANRPSCQLARSEARYDSVGDAAQAFLLRREEAPGHAPLIGSGFGRSDRAPSVSADQTVDGHRQRSSIVCVRPPPPICRARTTSIRRARRSCSVGRAPAQGKRRAGLRASGSDCIAWSNSATRSWPKHPVDKQSSGTGTVYCVCARLWDGVIGRQGATSFRVGGRPRAEEQVAQFIARSQDPGASTAQQDAANSR